MREDDLHLIAKKKVIIKLNYVLFFSFTLKEHLINA